MKEWALVFFVCSAGDFSSCLEDTAKPIEQYDNVNDCAPKMYTRQDGAFMRVALCKHQGDEDDVNYKETGDHA